MSKSNIIHINEMFMKKPVFIKACELSGIPITKRQASKFRNEKGKAFKRKNDALKMIKSESTKED